MWFMVCRWPQSHEGDWTRHHCVDLHDMGHGLPGNVEQGARVTREIEIFFEVFFSVTQPEVIYKHARNLTSGCLQIYSKFT